MTVSRIATIRRSATSVLLALVLAGCGVRVGEPPGPVPAPDSAQDQRQEIALALQRVHHAATHAPGAEPELVEVLTEYLDAMGGVWLPPPRDDNPTPTSPILQDPPLPLTAAAQKSAEDILQAIPAAPEDQRRGLVSMWLTMTLVSGAPAAACLPPCGAGMIPPTLTHDLPKIADLVGDSAPDLIGIYDALAYVEQVRAARSAPQERGEIADGAHALRAFAEALAGARSGTDADTRQAAYPVDPQDLTASARAYLEAASTQWLIMAAASPEAEITDALWYTYALTNPDLDLTPWPGLAE